jgi:hypothetical protein
MATFHPLVISTRTGLAARTDTTVTAIAAAR